MSNLIQFNQEQTLQDIVLSAYETEDGLSLKIDERTSLVYGTQRDTAELFQIDRRTLSRQLEGGAHLDVFLREQGVSAHPKPAKLIRGGVAHVFDIKQLTCMAEFYGSSILEDTKSFGLNSKLLAMVGYKSVVIKPADQVLIESEAVRDLQGIKRIAGGCIATMLKLPGYADLGNSIGWVEPNFGGKELECREWVELHFPNLPLYSGANMLRIGRAFSQSVIQNHQELATNSYKRRNNKYQEVHHQVLCATFYNIRKLGLLI